MKISRLVCLTVLISCGISVQNARAATIPAGTAILVKTSTAIHARDVKGRKFQGQLARSIGAGVHAGASVTGVVQSSWYTIASTTHPLTLRLTEIVINGHAVTVKTDDFEAQNSSPWNTRRGVQVTGGNFVLPPGTILQFRLTHSVEI
ncbi:MAG TPA: hypothetical protein VGM62_16050 [Chthoniobacterales bacterium]